MEKELQQLKKLLKHHKRMRKMYEECNNKTYCGGNAVMQESYNISRLEEWENVKALRLAVKLLQRAQEEKLKT